MSSPFIISLFAIGSLLLLILIYFLVKKLFLNRITPQLQSGLCDICQVEYPLSYLINTEALVFCKPHADLYQTEDWVEFISIISEPNEPERGVQLVEWKNYLWESKRIPSLIISQYHLKNKETVTHQTLRVPFPSRDHIIRELDKLFI